MKIIDLLNKIAKGEEVPKKIKYNKKIYEYSQKDNRYHNVQGGLDLSSIFGDYNFNYLNDEIEIIEEKPKKIEEVLEIELLSQCDNWLQHRETEEKSCIELNPYILKAITSNFRLLYHKQCELTKAVNYLLEKESDE